ncbi:hypothetical protein TNCV_3720181 [Trichonephila clavipes]|nr:hypothetical protein TNCV_3720181 [Trichonephila clavipes]
MDAKSISEEHPTVVNQHCCGPILLGLFFLVANILNRGHHLQAFSYQGRNSSGSYKSGHLRTIIERKITLKQTDPSNFHPCHCRRSLLARDRTHSNPIFSLLRSFSNLGSGKLFNLGPLKMAPLILLH